MPDQTVDRAPSFPVFQDLVSRDIPLERLFLDPNNPRFVGSDWQYIPIDEIASPSIQEEAQRRLTKDFAIDKLRMNMEVNGYLPIDRIIVKEFSPDNFVVLEGNRRVCAAKMISKIAPDGSIVADEILESLRVIPVLQYTGTDQDAAWIFQGLRHISGISEWSAFNKAKLLVEQMEEENLNLSDVGRRFGLTKFGAGQWARGYYAFKQAREESDYIAEVDERSYPYFQELFSRSSIPLREWLGWDDDDYRFKNELNFNEFVGWLYPRITNQENDDPADIKGDWDRRYLARRDDLRTVSHLLREAPDAFQQFRVGGDLEGAYSLSLAKKYEKKAKEDADPVQEVFDSLQQCVRLLDNIPYKALKDDTTRSRLFTAFDALQSAIAEIRG